MPESAPGKKPHWLRRKLPSGGAYERTRQLISHQHLNTVCKEANCPNRFECYENNTATFMILGDVCTRNCRFCAVRHGHASSPDPDEPLRVAQAIREMQLTYAVITSVTRDDLPDGGADAFARTISAIRRVNPHTHVEVLVPDFNGDPMAMETVLRAGPVVFGHNMETVKRLYSQARPDAVYTRSLEVLETAKKIAPHIFIKSGLMLGLGETGEEVHTTLDDLAVIGLDILSLGQYLRPSKAHLPVAAYIPPETFDRLKAAALSKGIRAVAAGPFVRSSYQAARLVEEIRMSDSFEFGER